MQKTHLANVISFIRRCLIFNTCYVAERVFASEMFGLYIKDLFNEDTEMASAVSSHDCSFKMCTFFQTEKEFVSTMFDLLVKPLINADNELTLLVYLDDYSLSSVLSVCHVTDRG